VSALGLALLLGLTIAGIPPQDAGAVAPEKAQPVRTGAATSGGSFYVEWWTEPAPVPLNEMFEIHFRVLEPGDHQTLVDGAVVTADAWMPEHNHGTPLQPRIESPGDGTATGRGFLLQMEGHWELRVGVAAGGRMERAIFPIDLGA
jgi:hypothetical protein